jgi:hypothetical protein
LAQFIEGFQEWFNGIEHILELGRTGQNEISREYLSTVKDIPVNDPNSFRIGPAGLNNELLSTLLLFLWRRECSNTFWLAFTLTDRGFLRA